MAAATELSDQVAGLTLDKAASPASSPAAAAAASPPAAAGPASASPPPPSVSPRPPSGGAPSGSTSPNPPPLGGHRSSAPAPSGALAGSSSSSAPRLPPAGMGARRAGMGLALNGGAPPRGPVLGGGSGSGGGGSPIAGGAGPRPGGATPMPPGLAAKLAAQRSANPAGGLRAPPPGSTASPVPPSLMNRPRGLPTSSAPPATMGGLAARRAAAAAASGGVAGAPGARLPPGGPPGAGGGLGGRRFAPPGRPAGGPGGMSLSGPGGPGGMSLSGMGGLGPRKDAFSNFGKIVDASGRLNFSSKAVLHAEGVDFSSGQSYKINMTELTLMEELGKGQYGTVQKVYHKPTKVVMAMKEIHLELDESKLNGILMELDILHRAIAPQIVEFYGAFFIESCVYYCMEFMDAGSLDKVYAGGVDDEKVLATITKDIVTGLGFLKDTLQIMHRDVKPTNILVNRKGEVKLCDFGVSGQLEKSLAKTNIGCETYMAPERITGEYANQLGTYSVSSDVWSLGLSIIEIAIGKYPYPPETFSSPLAQLQAIVHGQPPTLPDTFSAEARDFVASCLRKEPTARPTYGDLLKHPWLKANEGVEVDMPAWVNAQLEKRKATGGSLPPLADPPASAP